MNYCRLSHVKVDTDLQQQHNHEIHLNEQMNELKVHVLALEYPFIVFYVIDKWITFDAMAQWWWSLTSILDKIASHAKVMGDDIFNDWT